MVEVNLSFTDFSAGEIAPDLYGRFDLKPYYRSGRRVQNFIVQSTGMARYRTGTIFVAKTRQGQKARLIRFDLTESSGYVLEFTNLKLRFHRDGAPIRLAAKNITGITKANPAVVTYSGSDTYANGDSVFIDGVVGMTEVNGREFVVANVNTGANTFELSGVNSTAYATYSSGGTIEEIYEVTTPYTEAQIFDLKFAQQTGTIMYITHESHNPRKLEIVTSTSWTLTSHSPIRETFANSQSISNITQANPAVVTYTGSDTFTNGDSVLLSDILGMIELNDERYTVANVNAGANTFELSGVNSTGYTAYSSGGTIQRVVSSAAPFLSAGNYPRACGFYEQRLVYGGSTNSPATLYFSRSALPNDFSLGEEVDDGIEYTIAGGVGRVNWLRGTERFLGIGGESDVLQATGGIDGVITSTSISIRPSNAPGCANYMPIGRGTQIFFIQDNKLVLRSFEYDFQRDGYVPIDRNLIAPHITKSGLVQIEYENGRPNILWAVRSDGVLAGLTVEEGEAIPGWHRHTTQGEFVSIASESRSANYDATWVVVKRGDEHFIEYFADYPIIPRREDYVTDDEETDLNMWRNMLFEAQKQYIHLDSALSYYGDSIGEAAGATMTPSAVTGSSVTFTASASVFTSNMVGREIWRKSVTGAEYGRAEITGYTSGTVVTCQILEDFNSTAAIPAGEWYLTADEFTGLQHLEGYEVSVVTDGGQHDVRTVENGSITLDRQSSVVHVGLSYTGYLETNDLEGGGTNGTAQTKRKSVVAVGFRFLDTLYARYGTGYYNLNQIEMRTASMKMDRPPELFTGDTKEIYANDINDPRDGGWARSKRAIVSQDQPFPCNVQLIVPYLSVSN
jgi:hypothetical protein